MTYSDAKTTTGRSFGAAGKYLTFTLGEETYGLEILTVQEIIGILPVTHVPNTPAYVRGVINLRGKVIPVVDLRLKFGLEAAQDTERTCIIVLQTKREDGIPSTTGIIVDSVSEVLAITEEQIEEPPSFGDSVEIDFLKGIAKVGDKVCELLDLERTLSSAAIVAAAEGKA
ncbi:MAG: chemotaxis protein CheW [Candidatus Hydrogenedentes bacterium]|nr:chemotaxis protein CheW [Candidatus Hydrogenedentota bacterium]